MDAPFFLQFEMNTPEEDILFAVIGNLLLGPLWYWRIFQKAGKPGWWSMLWIFNVGVLAQVARKPFWYGFLAAIITAFPVSLIGFGPAMGLGLVSLVMHIFLAIWVCRSFGRESGGMVILCLICGIGYMVLGFGEARYLQNRGYEDVF